MYIVLDSGATIPKQRIFLDPYHGTFCHLMDPQIKTYSKIRIYCFNFLYQILQTVYPCFLD